MSKKTDILKAATYLFANKGFKETSMSEVAAMTGTAGSNIFYHYKTKEEIFFRNPEKYQGGDSSRIRKIYSAAPVC